MSGDGECAACDIQHAAGHPETEAAEPKEKWRANYVPAPHFYNLNQAVVLLDRAFAGYDHYGTYLVGSSLERRDFRDVDVRIPMVLTPEDEPS